jgi:hypothetical protein
MIKFFVNISYILKFERKDNFLETKNNSQKQTINNYCVIDKHVTYGVTRMSSPSTFTIQLLF